MLVGRLLSRGPMDIRPFMVLGSYKEPCRVAQRAFDWDYMPRSFTGLPVASENRKGTIWGGSIGVHHVKRPPPACILVAESTLPDRPGYNVQWHKRQGFRILP